MLNNKTIAVVVPAYNEATQIGFVIDSMPDFVDRIIIVNDFSSDSTAEIVADYIRKDTKEKKYIPRQQKKAVEAGMFSRADEIMLEQEKKELRMLNPSEVANANPEYDRIILINHKKNAGVGGAVATGYQWCREYAIDCIAKVDGDGQMDPRELQSICLPIVNGEVDYVKGNRLIHRSAWLVIPKVRYFGNSILSILTKIASGYWHISDTQTAYSAISLTALNAIRIHTLYRSYGYPNDILVKLNIAFCSVKEVEIKPVYGVGEQSKMKLFKVIPKISWLLFKSFFKRLWIKYLFRDFHPLFIFYNLGFLLFIFALPYAAKIVDAIYHGYNINTLPVLAFAFLMITSVQFILFAMWMDIQDNERLYKTK